MPPKRCFEQTEAAKEVEQHSVAGASAEMSARASNTLFISRLPFSATTIDLQSLFSDVGPLRRAFVVTDPNTKTSKGVGYVTFSIFEDAQRALTKLQGKKLDGKRAITITWADAKPAKGATATTGVGEPAQKRPRGVVPAARRDAPAPADKDPDAIRTVILTGLAACQPAADVKTLYKRARKIADVENIVYPLTTGIATEGNHDTAHIIFRTPNHAATAVSKLHAHTFKGTLLSAVLKKKADRAAKLAARMRPETREKMDKIRQEVAETSKAATLPPLESIPVAGMNHESRLIIRNLPFDVDSSDLRAVFLPFGPIYKIYVPQKTAEPKTKAKNAPAKTINVEKGDKSNNADDSGSKSVPFATEASTKKEEGESSLTAVPEQSTSFVAPIRTKGRGFAFVWMVSKADASRAVKSINGRAIRHGEAEKVAVKAAKGSKGRQLAQQKFREVRDNAQPQRAVAVDWALSKQEWKKKEEAEEVEEAEVVAHGIDSEDDGAKDDDSVNDGLLSHEVFKSDDEEKEKKPALPKPSEGTTLFVRNLPYDATETELLSLFKQFGPVRYARITMDRSTDPPRSKGSGFVCFWNREDTLDAIKCAREVEEEAGTGRDATKSPALVTSNPFIMKSLLTADPSAPLTSNFNIRGRILNVTLAVEREKADLLTAAGQKARQKRDKRNIYLMREGVPLPGTPLAKQLGSNEKELERRLASFSQRKSQLAANPSLFISKTRLSVRQLPLFCTDRMLKRLAIHAIKSFKAEVSEGKRKDLDPDESSDRTFSPLSKPPKKGELTTSIIQAKIVRTLDRPDPVTGLGGRSKGFGFLEVRNFTEALKILRWGNANRDVGKLLMHWHIEELEDLKKRLDSGDATAGKKGHGENNGDDSMAAAARLKRVSQRLAELKEGGANAARSLDKAERGGLLFVEFSVENATIVKQRRDRAEQNRKNAERRKQRDNEGGGGPDKEGEDSEEEKKDEDRRLRKQKSAARNRSIMGESSHQSSDRQGSSFSKAASVKTRKAREQASDRIVAEQSTRHNRVGSLIGRKRAKKRKAGKS